MKIRSGYNDLVSLLKIRFGSWFVPVILLTVSGCRVPGPDLEALKSEIEKTEFAFVQLASESGIHKAFLEYAEDDAILIRNSRALVGKTAIKEYFARGSDEGQTLEWKPRKIEVALSGDLAYSFGDFIFTRLDSAGIRQTTEGNYCTIWKRRQDGSWKFVVD